MPETAVVVTVPEADELVETSPGGIPAHVTLLYPFADGSRIAGMADELRSELARFPSFTLTLSRLGRFDGSPAVVYAEPEPPEPFLAMTERLTARFGFLPYGGVHDELIPHLTLAVGDDPRVLDTIASNAARRLPISCGVDAAEVWEHAPSGWRMLHRLALGE